MPDFTALELAILDAIADETVDQAPELPGQIADARVTERVNTGSGFITRIQVDPTRTAPIQSATAHLGTIHADIGGLADPVGFRAVIQDGRLTALEADAYGQATSAMNFATASFSNLFRITPEGESVAVQPAFRTLRSEGPLRRLRRVEETQMTPFGVPSGLNYLDKYRGPARFLRDRLAASRTGRRVLEVIATPVPRSVAVLLRIIVYLPFVLGLLLIFSFAREIPVGSDIVAVLGPQRSGSVSLALFLTSFIFFHMLELRRQAIIRRRVLQN